MDTDEIKAQVRKDLFTLRDRLGSWDAVANKLELPKGTLNAIANGEFDPTGERNPRLITALGWPTLKPAPACTKCGEVHVAKRCTKKRVNHHDLYAMDEDDLRRALENRYILNEGIEKRR